MTQQENLKLLWDKYVSDQKLNASEIRQLRELIQDDSNREFVDSLLNGAYDQNPETAPAEYSSTDAFRDVWQKLQLEKNEPAPIIAMSPRRNWWKYAVAASVVIAIGIIFYQLRSPQAPQHLAGQKPTSQSTDVSIQPGGNNALLTLADGSVVTLNDLENGLVASQGGTNVIKLANGELAYETGAAPSGEVSYNTIVTPRGGKYRLILPDGSKVWMNAESTLRYPTSFTGKTREVNLTGEAYFEIAHNPGQPFNVMVKNTKVEVLGTHFDVMAYENESAVSTTLLEGSVLVSSPVQQLRLKPGQQALQSDNGGIKLMELVDLQQVLAWKNDYFQFNGDKLDRLMRQIERWYDVSVVFEGPVPDRKFGGKFPLASPLKDILKALELSDVKFHVTGKTITVTNN